MLSRGSTRRKKKPTGVAAVKAAGSVGRRKGTKRSDLRYIAPDGSEWASPFEYRVYAALLERNITVRRTTPADALAYSTPVKNGWCANCQHGGHVVQNRVYTPDLLVVAKIFPEKVYYLETKGYFPAAKRNLFRQARLSNPQADVRLVVSSNHWVTKGKTRLTDWAKRYKIPIAVWDGKLPDDWL